MSSRYLYVTCPRCGTTELVYIGDVDLDNFDISGESIHTLCYECVEQEATDE